MADVFWRFGKLFANDRVGFSNDNQRTCEAYKHRGWCRWCKTAGRWWGVTGTLLWAARAATSSIATNRCPCRCSSLSQTNTQIKTIRRWGCTNATVRTCDGSGIVVDIAEQRQHDFFSTTFSRLFNIYMYTYEAHHFDDGFLIVNTSGTGTTDEERLVVGGPRICVHTRRPSS